MWGERLRWSGPPAHRFILGGFALSALLNAPGLTLALTVAAPAGKALISLGAIAVTAGLFGGLYADRRERRLRRSSRGL
jgi:hypothetical protein